MPGALDSEEDQQVWAKMLLRCFINEDYLALIENGRESMKTVMAWAASSLEWMNTPSKDFKKSFTKLCLDMFSLVQKAMMSIKVMLSPKPPRNAEVFETHCVSLPRTP